MIKLPITYMTTKLSEHAQSDHQMMLNRIEQQSKIFGSIGLSFFSDFKTLESMIHYELL